MISTIEFLVVCWSHQQPFDLQDRESYDNHEVLDTKGCRPKELRWSNQHVDHRKDPCGCKIESKRLGTKEEVTVTGNLWLGGGCLQGWIGTTVVYGTQESGESSLLGGGNVESQVEADRKRTRWRGSKVVQELQVKV